MDFLQDVFLGNTVRQWITALIAFAVTWAVLWLLKRVILRQLGRLAPRTASKLDDAATQVLAKTRGLFLFLVSLFVAVLVLDFSPTVERLVRNITVIAVLVQIGIWANEALAVWLTGYKRRALGSDPASVTTMTALVFIGRLAVWIVVALLALENLNVDVSALVAGLGIGGIAVALAVQNVLGDLFASLSIVLDKPFVIGDYLTLGEQKGTVEAIGLKTTRLRSLSGEQLVFSNADLLSSRIHNYGRMRERRAVFTIGVTYETPREKVAAVPDMIREIIEAQELTRFDRAHFNDFGPYSLNIEAVYYVEAPEYGAYLDIQQQINLEILRRFAEEEIEFAYPTQLLYLHADPQTAQVAKATA